ncbi:ly6/PLAUR domain-containing protein 2-like [Pleurodeles waltl]|uniref:ly6/PLAUR domain-containing protein 2-like n=1 Tax=Pleurodeles waltl TaxID=8319 RepID=UPI003709BC4F
MKVICCTLLAVAMLSGIAHSSLHCFTCTEPASPVGCLTSTTCNEKETFCKTNITISAGFLVTSKKCASTCSQVNAPGVLIKCCKSSLCNILPTNVLGYKKIMA